MKNKGLRFLPGTVNDWMDNGNKDVAVQTNAKILEYAAAEGEKLIAADLVRENAKIIPPCYIGEGVRLKNSTIGPHVSIGAGTVVENSHIRNSLIQNNSLIKNARLANSMIGNNVVFDGNFDNVSLGDFSQLTVQNK
jgi:glucose-1-phosphate thymidylyltransferase